MTPPNIIAQLVERFDQQRQVYRAGRYNETQLRREFLDPFFEALGWDMTNRDGLAEIYKEVIHEDSLEIEGENKAPDYAFRIGGTRKFFVEAKKPAVNIEFNIHPAFQLRRYAWSAKLPLGILTDFEEFAIYDCRVKPDKGDKASTARILLFSYKDYLDKWDEIVSVFSREAVLKGSFDSYAETLKSKKGTTEVDDAFLAEIERWRDLLARNLAQRNPNLTARELNYAVQMTIDRIVFLRICEDRGIERDEQLKDISTQKNIYENLVLLFQRADARYNSGLFHFKNEKEQSSGPDSLTLHLKIDDRVLHDILSNLYYPESPYVFREIPSDILGQVYERFLGKVIRLTDGHQAKIEEKPEVRKAGGVYYTPTYIVDYIVQNTVGKLLEGKTPKDAAKLKILDPACGSGTFPLGAYQYLLDWHLKWFAENTPEKWLAGKNPAIYQSKEGYKLTTAKKKEILLNNIFGVDIDAQAVEVTKLSLLLKVLEGESQETIGSQLSFLQERVLPDLGKNIQCGNSIIDPDYYEGQQLTMSFADQEERYRVNAFDWKGAFPHVFVQGGFDAVIGNPPYIRMEEFKDLKTYLKRNYISHDERSDMYAYFIEKEHKLLNEKGRFGMIVSNKFLRANYGKPLREFIRQSATIERIVDFAGLPVFKGATVRTIVIISSRKAKEEKAILYTPPLAIEKFMLVQSRSLPIEGVIAETTYEVPASTLAQDTWSFATQERDTLLERIKNKNTRLVEYCDGQICRGVVSGLTEAFVINSQTRNQIIDSNPEAAEVIKPFLNGRDVRRYKLEPKDIYLIYTYRGVNIDKYPAIEQHLRPFKARLMERATRQEWYELQQPQYAYKEFFESPKIVFPDIATAPRFVLDEKGHYGSNTIYFIPRRDLYLLGLLNSKLGYFYFRIVCAGLEGAGDTYLRFFGQYLEGFPVKIINFSDAKEKARHDKLVSLVERILELQKRYARTPQEQELVKREIESLDRQIDEVVYQLYGLAEEEIKLVENKS
jgi:type I restriction-modification system DNA methylase subunit